MKFRRLNYYEFDYCIEYDDESGMSEKYDVCIVSAKNQKKAAAKFAEKYTGKYVKRLSFRIKKLEKIIGEE
ncbi:unnamed protein product [Fructobacillus fructosus]|uniref:Phage protein n=1 Tax=Fructobacillus fructosus TaxID=1631 RepID=A0ABM9MME2_9LACO|nr:unnamed protein product [Fructobacillus fructosus]